jgi:hypothetical protein
MNTSEKKEFNNLLIGTFEVYVTKLTPASIMIWANSMDKYSFSDLKNALSYHIQSSPFAPKPSDLIHIIQAQDGRPSADEAWGMIPRNESVSAILSQEMLTAMAAAQPLLNEGDQVAARMAFKESYSNLVNSARQTSRPVEWFPSLGDDKYGREAVVKEAIRLGRISETHGKKLLPQITNWTELMRLS